MRPLLRTTLVALLALALGGCTLALQEPAVEPSPSAPAPALEKVPAPAPEAGLQGHANPQVLWASPPG